MFFQLLSDLHLERRHILPVIKKTADVLFLAGDIGSPHSSLYKEFLYNCSHQFAKTVLVTGNHEYWGSTITDTDGEINSLVKKLRNVFFLNNTFTFHNDRMIFGATHWSRIRNVALSSFDSERIHNFSIDERNRQHSVTSELIRRLRPEVVLTHYPPVRNVLRRQVPEERADFFTNDQPDLLAIPSVWACGHLHRFIPYPKVLMSPYVWPAPESSQTQ